MKSKSSFILLLLIFSLNVAITNQQQTTPQKGPTTASTRPKVSLTTQPVEVKDGFNLTAWMIKEYNMTSQSANIEDQVVSCGKTGAPDGSQCLIFGVSFNDTDGNVDRTYGPNGKIRVAPGTESKSRNEMGPNIRMYGGETWSLEWYFYVFRDYLPIGGIIHQIGRHFKGGSGMRGGTTVSLALLDNELRVRLRPNPTQRRNLSVPFPTIVGKWLHVQEKVFVAENGWAEVNITDAGTGAPILIVPRVNNIPFWNALVEDLTPGVGIYRMLGSGYYPPSHIAFSKLNVKKVTQ